MAEDAGFEPAPRSSRGLSGSSRLPYQTRPIFRKYSARSGIRTHSVHRKGYEFLRLMRFASFAIRASYAFGYSIVKELVLLAEEEGVEPSRVYGP